MAVAAVGLDRFSGVNTALGRPTGNEVLREVAARLRAVGRAARLGGDEFAVIATGPDARKIGDRVAAVLGRPVEVDGRSVFLGASIGVAVAPVDAEDADELLQHADTAMQVAKERGGGLVLAYAGDLRSEVEDRLAVASALQQAIEGGELSLHYQPIVDSVSRAIVGMEALVRWVHPTLGTIAPDRFIPIAEETGLIVPLGEWVVEEACRQAAGWQRIAPLRLAVNLSARQFEHQRIDDVIAGALARSGLDPSLLDVELTERAVLHDDTEVAAALERLRAVGVGCSVDDFGTGYGGFSYLIRFPVVELKIDRSFVQNIGVGTDHAAIVLGLINLARDLGLRVVAEGVEHASQATFLAEHGCDQFQGYLVSRPLPPERFEALLAGTPVHEAPPARTPSPVPTPAPSVARPAAVRPGPRRQRRRLAPAITLGAAGAVFAMTGNAAALPASVTRTVAAIVESVQDAAPFPLFDRGDEAPSQAPSAPAGVPATGTAEPPADAVGAGPATPAAPPAAGELPAPAAAERATTPKHPAAGQGSGHSNPPDAPPVHESGPDTSEPHRSTPEAPGRPADTSPPPAQAADARSTERTTGAGPGADEDSRRDDERPDQRPRPSAGQGGGNGTAEGK